MTYGGVYDNSAYSTNILTNYIDNYSISYCQIENAIFELQNQPKQNIQY